MDYNKIRDAREVGKEVQRDPLYYLLSQGEKQTAKNLGFRMLFDFSAMGLYSLYFLSRNNELQRLGTIMPSGNMIWGLSWRWLVAYLVADQVSRRMFVNYAKLREHKMAEYEMKKIMVKWPHAKQLPLHHRRANSVFWV